MKRIYTLLVLLACTICLQAATLPTGAEWKRALRHNPFQQTRKQVVSKGEATLGPTHSFGTLNAPDGTEWVYTANFDIDEERGYTAAHIKIYDSHQKLLGTIDDEFELAEHQTAINSVKIDPNVTQKFFNVDDKYEVILFVHATTDDFAGYCYQHIFSLAKDQNEPLMEIPGYEVLVADLATDSWSEKKQMVMMREEFTDDGSYFIHYDIYDRASWSSPNAPALLHTFTLDYAYLAGSGNNAYPISVQNIGGEAHYAIAYYEKPFFDPEYPVWEEPVVMPDNTFIIDLYRASELPADHADVEATPYKTIRIPMQTEDGYLFSFPGIGGLCGNDDFAVGVFDDTQDPYFVITVDNYETASDDFITSFYIYNKEGELVKTFAKGITDYVLLSDIDGCDPMFCMTDDANEVFRFINFPSGEQKATIGYEYDGRLLSTGVDRVVHKNSFNIVISGRNGESDELGNVLHPIGVFDANGSFKHWDKINLGPDVTMATPAIIGEWMNPYLYNTDSDAEYMFIIKQLVDDGSDAQKTEERFWVMKANGEKLADFGPDDEMGALSTIEVLNALTSEPMLSVAYYDWQTDEFTLNFCELPFTRFTAGGNGAADDPYLVSNVGDLMLIDRVPNAHYRMAADIDCDYYPIKANKCDFTGTLDGAGHVLKNLHIAGCGLISDLVGGAVVKDLRIEGAIASPADDYAGLIASTARYDGASAPKLVNILVDNAALESDGYEGVFGGIVGQLTTGAKLSMCLFNNSRIKMPKATVGGFVGDVVTSGAEVNAVAFVGGEIVGGVAGGVVGSASLAAVNNAHVNANVVGTRAAGGVVGEMEEFRYKRGTFTNCIVEGSVSTVNNDDASVGGIAGRVAEGDNLCISHNIVNALVGCSSDVTVKSAHRVAGHTCADELGMILWDDPWWDSFEGDPYDYPELWPRAEVLPDAGFEENYATTTVPFDENEALANDAKSVEGKTIELVDINSEFLANQGFAMGESTDAPWSEIAGQLCLWFEDGSAAGIEIAQTGEVEPAIIIHGGEIVARGEISIFNVAGVKVASASQRLSIANLLPGIYVATCADGAVKFRVD